jgi:ABC-type phosphate transport system permease subunit
MYAVLILMLISTVLPVSIANAAFLEDYAHTPTKKSLNTILDYCAANPDGSIATDLVNTSKISDFYAEYTCEDAAQEKAWLEGNQSNTARITILH